MADGNNRLFRQPRAVIDEAKAVSLYLQAQGGLQSRECRHRVIDLCAETVRRDEVAVGGSDRGFR